MSPTSYALMITFRVWLLEVPLAAFNAFVLMDRVYAPRTGAVRAHQLAMSTRIVWVVVLAFVITHYATDRPVVVLLVEGLFWMTLWLAFEWAGSLLIRRPVHEILVGWHVENGYRWPYVLLAYLLSPLIAGTLTRAATG
jgi:hypothetical protein